METFEIKSFRPIEAKEDSSDQDRTVLRLCEGLLPVPQGALSTGPEWKELWGLDDLRSQIETALAGANGAKTHIVTLTKAGRTFLIAWSLHLDRALGLVEVTRGTSYDLDSTTGITLTATNTAVFRDKDGSAQWFGSRIGDRWFLGNGVDTNLVWSAGTLALLGPATPPANIYDRARYRIPACTCFRQHVNRSIFAAGNAASPMRVWITDAPSAADATIDGVYSLDTSFIDVHPHAGATRISALSVYQQYVTVHTDKAPVNLYGVDNTSDGWKCEQSPSAANASAMNPNCVGDADGDASFYLGSDLELYTDQAVRSGPHEKRSARDQEVVTLQAAGIWNRDMLRPPASYGYSVIYDRATRLLWVFAISVFNDRGMVWVFNERSRTLAGPIHYPDAVVSTTILGQYAIVITAAGAMLYADLAAVGERIPDEIEPDGTALGSAYDAGEVEPTPDTGVPVVGMTGDRLTWIEKLGSSTIGFTNPFARIATIDPEEVDVAEWFNNAHIARFETPWLDFGAPGVFKDYLDIVATLERASRGYLAIYAEAEGQKLMQNIRWFGNVHPKTSVRKTLTLFGHRVRFRFCLVVFNDARLLVRDARIGFNPAGQT